MSVRKEVNKLDQQQHENHHHYLNQKVQAKRLVVALPEQIHKKKVEVPEFKLVLMGNGIPSENSAFLDRFEIIPFQSKFDHPDG
jgi:hypothetical protein